MLSGQGFRTIAVAADVDDLMMPGVMALGAETVVASDRVVGRLHEFLPRLV